MNKRPKRLFLLRHAQSPAAYGAPDFERSLSPEGEAQARTLGKIMKDKAYQPELIYCSPALRTKQTLRGLLESLEDCPAHAPKILYEGGCADVLNLIRQTPKTIQTLLVIAHNPGIHQLAAQLAQDGPATYEQLTTGYAPATLTALACDFEEWHDIQAGENMLMDLISPAP